MTRKEWSLRRKVIVGIAVVVAVFAAIMGIVYGVSSSNKADVMVIPVYDANYGSDEDETATMDGVISTGSSQTITYDSGKTILEIKVSQGDHVKKGDPLVVYDMTQTSDELEQRQLDVRSVELAIKQAQRTLDTLNSAVEMVVPEEADEDEEDEEEEDVDEDEEEGDADEDSVGDPIPEDASKALEFRSIPVTDDNTDNTASGTAGQPTGSTAEGGTDSVAPSGNAAGGTEGTQDAGSAPDSGANAVSDAEEAAEDEEDSEDEEDGPDLSDYDAGTVVYVDSEGNVYTVPELRRAKLESEKELRGLETDLAEANADLAQSQKSLDSSTVTSTLDGVVTLVDDSVVAASSDADEEEDGEDNYFFVTGGVTDGAPVVQVTTFEGIYVNTAINEWALGTVSVGDTIYVMDWNSGDTYPARITDILPYASADAGMLYSDGDSDDSYYPVKALIEQDGVSLVDGSSVEVSLSKPEDYDDEEEDEAIYLYKAFVVSEGEQKYVYKADKEGKLKKQRITVSGQEQETYIVTGGITEDDYIAFPFGDNIREGAPTVEGSIDDLYEDY